MRGFFRALQFLTILPVKLKDSATDTQMLESRAYFPLMGLFIGGILALGYEIFNLIFSHPVACAFTMILNAAITGGLHIDGFVDAFDAVFSGGDKEKMLSIMREGRPGALGIAAVMLLFIAKYSILVSLPAGTVEVSLIAMTMFGRWSLVFSSALYPYARDTQGLGGKFIGKLSRKGWFISTGCALLFSFFIFKFRIFILIPVLIIFAAGFNGYFRKKLGGITGDTLGALNETVEVLILALATALI